MEINKNYLLQLPILLTLFLLLVTQPMSSQQTGSFVTTITWESGSREVWFFVPYNYKPTKSYPVIIGMHPAVPNGEGMREMMKASAEQLDAILACPDDPSSDANELGKVIFPTIDYIKSKYKIDSTTIILTGYSKGGFATFNTGLNN